MSPRLLFPLAAAFVTTLLSSVHAQQAGVGGSLAPVGHSFHESIGLSWGLQGNGWFYNSGGLPPIPFGLGGGGGGASFGGGFGGGGLNGGFQILAQQGSDTTLGSASPSVTVMNGGMGYFSDTTIRPFVTGLVPVVGNMPSAPPIPFAMPQQAHPLAERLGRLQAEGAPPPRAAADEPVAPAPEKEIVLGGGGPRGGPSSAERGDLSVAEIKARKAAAEGAPAAEIAVYVEKAKALEADGKPSVARVYYQMAARRATGEERTALVEKLRQLDAAK